MSVSHPFQHVLNMPASFQPPPALDDLSQHVNIIVASLALGGAERGVLDVVHGLRQLGVTGVIYVLNHVKHEYRVQDDAAFPIISLAGLERYDQMRTIAAQVLRSPSTVVISHLVRSSQLQSLWQCGVRTIPVIHNSALAWHEPIENWESSHVPFIVAVSSDVGAQLRAAGCKTPIYVIRHEIQRWKSLEEHRHDRAEIRSRYGVSAETTLIGMVGQFKAHKAYVRAVRVLASLHARRKVKLMVVGGWEHDYGAGRHAHAATIAQAGELGVLEHLILVGPTLEATRYISAFDVFLNTSVYEGLSVACLEAAQIGCPLVLSDVGGQREIVAESYCHMVSVPSDIASYVRAIEAAPVKREAVPLPAPEARHLVPQLWSLIAEQAIPSSPTMVRSLFITANLNLGGPQRSLTNLLLGLGARHPCWLCVVERILGNEFIDTLRATNVGLAGVSPRGNIVDKAREILLLARRLGVQNIVFWNVESTLKLIVAKALEAAAINLIDVSPGPMLFEELDVVSALQRRIAYTADDYLGRLDHFVAKYEGGLPPARFTTRPKHVHVIPNGVASPAPRSGGAPSVRAVEVDPRYALVSCCRIAPSKRIEVLIEMMAHLSRTLPQASLTIVGGVDQRHLGYFEMLQRLIGARNIHNIHFVGPSADVFGFLDEFRAFVMIARNQGCPNASLEAMAMGLPIIANPDGGTVEQVLDGQTGYLVEDDPAQLAARAIELLMDENLSRRMGRAGRDRVLNHFSLEKMTVAYQRLLEGSR